MHTGKFLNNFFRSPSPFSYVILALVFLNCFHWVYYAAFANNFGALSHVQDLGYTFTSVSGLFFFFFGLFSVHALNVLWPSRIKVIIINFGLGVTFILSVCSFASYLYTPSKFEMQNHIFKRFVTLKYNQGFIQSVEMEKKCCGIISYRDYVELDKQEYEAIDVSPVNLPQSCCKLTGSERSVCKERVTAEDVGLKFNTEGCVKKGYWNLQTSAPISFGPVTTYFLCTIFHSASCLVCLVIFNYYICLKFPKRRAKCKEINLKIEQVYKEREDIINSATSDLEMAEYAVEGPAILEWYNVHYLPKFGSFGNLERISKTGYVLPKRYEFPLFPFQEYEKHPEKFVAGSNLDLYESKTVYESPPESKDELLKKDPNSAEFE